LNFDGFVRLTPSVFGTRKPDVPPEQLVLKILRQENFISQLTEWSIANESAAIEKKKQQENGHPVFKAGFIVSTKYPYLRATLMALCMIHHHPMSLTDLRK